MRRLQKLIRQLGSNKQAVALTEFALATPLVLTAGLWGIETGNLAITHMRVSQAAMHIADNASRIGDKSALSNRKIYENDVNDLFLGSNIQAGESIDLYEYGRVTLSSLQVYPGSEPEQQYIAWQRCKGRKMASSTYGSQNTGIGDPSFVGMGPPGEEVFAMGADPVMFVEVAYDYQPLVTDAFISDRTIQARAAFQVRAGRDLTEVFQRDPDSPDDIAGCDIYDSYKEIAPTPSGAGGWDWLFGDNPGGAVSAPPAPVGAPAPGGGGGVGGGVGGGGSGGVGGGSGGGTSAAATVEEESNWIEQIIEAIVEAVTSAESEGTATEDGGETGKCHITEKDGFHCHEAK